MYMLDATHVFNITQQAVPAAASSSCVGCLLLRVTVQVADIWSCGVMLYVMLVGAYPFERPEDKTDSQKLQKMIQVRWGARVTVPGLAAGWLAGWLLTTFYVQGALTCSNRQRSCSLGL
jgi:hypothetical protein